MSHYSHLLIAAAAAAAAALGAHAWKDIDHIELTVRRKSDVTDMAVLFDQAGNATVREADPTDRALHGELARRERAGMTPQG